MRSLLSKALLVICTGCATLSAQDKIEIAETAAKITMCQTEGRVAKSRAVYDACMTREGLHK